LAKPFISVIIPVYNQESYLRQCIDSILSQTLENIEIITVNDGSTDTSVDVIAEYVKKDKRVMLIDQKNMGVASARNKGIEVASGQFVAFMDADDWYPENDILQIMYQTAIDKNVKIVGGSLARWVDGKVAYDHDFSEKINSDYMFVEDELMCYRGYQFDYGFTRFIYHLELLRINNIQFPLYQRFEDPPFFCQAMVCANDFYALKKIVYMYRVVRKQINLTDHMVSDIICGIIDLLELSKKHRLEKLHFIAFYRLNKDYLCNMISDRLHSGNRNLLVLLAKANNAVDTSLLLDAESKIYSETWKVMNDFSQSDIVLIKPLFLLKFQLKERQEQKSQKMEMEKQQLEEKVQTLQNSCCRAYDIRNFTKRLDHILSRGRQCLKDHGLFYTIKYIFQKVLKYIKVK